MNVCITLDSEGRILTKKPVDIIAYILAQGESIVSDDFANSKIRSPLFVPESVTPWQMRRALNQMGQRAAVETAIAAYSQNHKDDWAVAPSIRRDSNFVAALASSRGYTGKQVDDLFILAATFQ